MFNFRVFNFANSKNKIRIKNFFSKKEIIYRKIRSKKCNFIENLKLIEAI